MGAAIGCTSRGRWSGMPWQMTSLTEVHTDLGKFQ